MHESRWRVLAAGGAACLWCLSFAGAAAGQAVSTYHPDAESREFSTSAGGWGSSTGEGGACTPLTCPTVTNSHQPSGGAGGAGDGHLRTEVSGTLGVSGLVTGAWLSPAFTYQGAGGQVPDRIEFALARRVALTNFVSASQNNATYTVEIVGAGGGGVAALVIDNQPLSDSQGFVPIGPLSVDPSQLAVGQQYQIRITTRFAFGSTVTPGGSVDYDDVALTAIDDPAPGGGSGGGGGPGAGGPPGPPGPQGPRGGNALDVAFLTSFIKNNTRNWVALKGRRAGVLVRCPGRVKQVAKSCRFSLTALVRRQGPNASKTAKSSLKPRAKREVGLMIRRSMLDELAAKETILMRYRVQVGKLRTTVYKQLRVVHCERAATC